MNEQFVQSLYVERKEITDVIKRWLANPAPDYRLVSLVGAVGSGKSWFLAATYHWLLEESSYLPIWLDLSGKLTVIKLSDKEILLPDYSYSMDSRRQWLHTTIQKTQNRLHISIPYDANASFVSVFGALVATLRQSCGSVIPVLLVDGFNEVVSTSDTDYVWEDICAHFYFTANCSRTIIARRDEISLPHHLLTWHEKIVHLPPLTDQERREQISRLDRHESRSVSPDIESQLTGNPLLNRMLYEQVAHATLQSDATTIQVDFLSALLTRSEWTGDLTELKTLGDLPETWTARELREKTKVGLESPQIEALFESGFIRQVEGTARYMIDSDLITLLKMGR